MSKNKFKSNPAFGIKTKKNYKASDKKKKKKKKNFKPAPELAKGIS